MKHKNNNISHIILLLVFILIAVVTLAIISISEEDLEEVSAPVPPHLYSSSQQVIGTGNKLGTYFPGGQLLAKWFNDHVDKSGGSFKAFETNGSIDNVKLLNSKIIQFGMAEARIVKEAYKENSNIRVVWPLWVDVVQIIRPPQKFVPDYVFPGDNRGFWGQKNSSTARTTKEILDALKINSKPSKYIPMNSIISYVGDGKLGFAMIQAGIPNHSVSDSLLFYNCELISFTPEQLDLIRSKVSTSMNYRLPAGYYKEDQPEINTIALPNVLVSTTETSPELVEFVAEMVLSGSQKLKGRFKAFETVPQNKESIVKILGETGVPLHEGTRRWLQKMSNQFETSDSNSNNGGELK